MFNAAYSNALLFSLHFRLIELYPVMIGSKLFFVSLKTASSSDRWTQSFVPYCSSSPETGFAISIKQSIEAQYGSQNTTIFEKFYLAFSMVRCKFGRPEYL